MLLINSEDIDRAIDQDYIVVMFTFSDDEPGYIAYRLSSHNYKRIMFSLSSRGVKNLHKIKPLFCSKTDQAKYISDEFTYKGRPCKAVFYNLESRLN